MKKKTKNLYLIIFVATLIISIFSNTNSTIYAADTSQFNIDKNGVLLQYTGIGGNVTIPRGVVAIGPKAFSGCSDIKKVTMPDTVKYIDQAAFDSCSSLTTVELSNKLTSIKDSAFWGCGSLKKISFPKSLKEIGYSAFTNCESLNGLYIPKSVTKIGNYAVGFMYYGEYVPTINYAIMGEKNSTASAYAKKYEISFLTRDNLKVSSIKAQKVKNNKIKVSWKRNTAVSGYQIQYSANKNFKKPKTITVTSNSITSKKLTSVKKGAKYYIRIRGYRSIAGTNYYSSWGKIKSISLSL